MQTIGLRLRRSNISAPPELKLLYNNTLAYYVADTLGDFEDEKRQRYAPCAKLIDRDGLGAFSEGTKLCVTRVALYATQNRAHKPTRARPRDLGAVRCRSVVRPKPAGRRPGRARIAHPIKRSRQRSTVHK